MSQIRIYNQETDSYSNVRFDLEQSWLSDQQKLDCHLIISTDMKKFNGSSFGKKLVRTLNDYPPSGSVASNFSHLCEQWIEYFVSRTKTSEIGDIVIGETPIG